MFGYRPDLDPGEAMRECMKELATIEPNSQLAQVFATLALREAVAELTEEIRLTRTRNEPAADEPGAGRTPK